MYQYKKMLETLLEKGQKRPDRTGTGTRSIFGYQERFDISQFFPIVTIKKTNFEAVKEELLWFLRGETNVKSLQEKGVHIWDEWADEQGFLGPIYGKQWRKWQTKEGYIDQIENIVLDLQENPYSRRHILTAWNVAEIDKMALAPCHCFCQFYVHEGALSAHVYQRSADAFLGVPFNIASYALLTHLFAQVCSLETSELVFSYGDLHLYENHIEQAKKAVLREPLPLPVLLLNQDVKQIFDFKSEDILLTNYKSHSFIKAPVSV